MGISPFKSSSYSSYDFSSSKKVVTPPNPNPKNYKILNSWYVEEYLVLRIKYPDCANYEGEKILVFYNVSIEDLEKQGSIDPHFSDNKNMISPIARFEPTRRGESMANILCQELHYREENWG
jgi:hypothetical protein